MKQASDIHDVHLPLHLPKIVLKTSATDFSAFKTLQLQRFDGTRWVKTDRAGQ